MPHLSNILEAKSFARKYIIRPIIFILLFVVVWQAYLLVFPHARINFTTYVPKGSVDTIRKPGIHNIFTPNVRVNYYTPDGFFSISQESKTEDESAAHYMCGESFTIDNTICSIYTTPKRQPYLLMTTASSASNGTPIWSDVSQSVMLYRGNTRIWIDLSGNRSWSSLQWDTFIDSLRPARIPHLPTKWLNPGP
jgi:hypothetical protein